MAKEWKDLREEEREEIIDKLCELDDDRMVEIWNKYNEYNRGNLIVRNIEEFDELYKDSSPAEIVNMTINDEIPSDWEYYKYFAWNDEMRNEFFDDVREFSSFDNMIDEEGWDGIAEFVVANNINID